MSTPHEILPRMEGILGTVPNADQAAAGLVVKLAREIMLNAANKDQTDWEFRAISDIDESVTTSDNSFESGARLYVLLIGQASADASADVVTVTDDADGAVTVAADSDVVSVPVLAYKVPVAATDGTEELWPLVFPKGVAFTNYMSFGADGADGTNPATDDLRGWVLYRTVAAAA